MSRPAVRPAVVEDATEIARVHIQAWQETYSRLVEPGELDDLSVDRRSDRWATLVGVGEPAVWVATIDGQIVGFASTRVGGDDAPRPRELSGIYVLAAQHGSGAGQGLLDAAIGDSPAFLTVAADNPRAQAFYRRNRFELDGHTESHVLVRTPIAVVRMVR
jgi:ribosomal protein S18 acetylase RimI-like enzyme